MVATDPYPTMRMVQSGQLTLTRSKNASKTLTALEMVEWAPASGDEQIVLSNGGDQPVQFVEWTVAPPQGVKP